MNYEITIRKTLTNENFDKELEAYKERTRYGNSRMDNSDAPQINVVKDVLLVEITEEQFKKVKAAVLEVF